MQTFVYCARFERGDKSGIVVTFPDLPEAITQGADIDDARAMAEDALGLALLSYPMRGLPMPKVRHVARWRGHKLHPITPAPEVTAKLAIISAFTAAGISKSELARRLGKNEKEVRRLLDPKHPTQAAAAFRGTPHSRQATGDRRGRSRGVSG